MLLIKYFSTLLFLIIYLTLSTQTIYRYYDYELKKYGLRDAQYNFVAPIIYDEIEPNLDTVFAGKINGKTLLFNGDGSIRVPPIYQHIQSHFNNIQKNYGFAAVTKDEKIQNSWGIIESRGKIILPEKFQYVRVLSPYLCVGKFHNDTLLQFFNQNGQPLFTIPGRTVQSNDFDPENTFNLERIDRKSVVYLMDGTLLYPENQTQVLWSDGNRIIQREMKSSNIIPKLGVKTLDGKILIPFNFTDIKPIPALRQFIVFQRQENYLESIGGVYDENGNTIIPLGNHEVQYLDECYMVTDLLKDKVGLMDSQGKEILQKQYSFSSIFLPLGYAKHHSSHPENYINVTDSSTNYSFILKKNGKFYRPDGSVSVKYLSDVHPLIIEMKPESGQIAGKFKLLNLNGQEILPAEYTFLDFTNEPPLFIGAKERNGKKGIVNIFFPDKTDFKYKFFSQMNNSDFYYGKTEEGIYEIFNKRLGRIYTGQLNSIQQPERKHFEKFRKDWQCNNESLIGVIRTLEMKGEEWAGISENGCLAYFKNTSISPVPESEKVQVAEIPVQSNMLDIAETDEISLPQKESPDDVLSKVDQPSTFPGNDRDLIKYYIDNLKYPTVAAENGIQGRLVVGFVVEKNGSITNIQVIRDIGGGCGAEAIRLVQSMPKWNPAKHLGKLVRHKVTLPITFNLKQ